MKRSGQGGRLEREPSRIVDLQGKPPQVRYRSAHRLHEGERLAIGAQQQVLAVVERRAAVLDAPSPSTGRPVRIEERDARAAAHELDGGGDPGPAGADDAHVPGVHVEIQVFHAIHSFRIGVRETRARITGNPSRRISWSSVR